MTLDNPLQTVPILISYRRFSVGERIYWDGLRYSPRQYSKRIFIPQALPISEAMEWTQKEGLAYWQIVTAFSMYYFTTFSHSPIGYSYSDSTNLDILIELKGITEILGGDEKGTVLLNGLFFPRKQLEESACVLLTLWQFTWNKPYEEASICGIEVVQRLDKAVNGIIG